MLSAVRFTHINARQNIRLIQRTRQITTSRRFLPSPLRHQILPCQKHFQSAAVGNDLEITESIVEDTSSGKSDKDVKES